MHLKHLTVFVTDLLEYNHTPYFFIFYHNNGLICMDMKFKEMKLKYLDYNGRVMVNIVTNATNKVLEDALKQMDDWNKDLFKSNIEKQGYMIEYIQFNTY